MEGTVTSSDDPSGEPAPIDRASSGRGDVLARWAAAIAVASSWGAVAGWWTPRGPLTTAQVLGAMGVGFVVGVVAALACRSRWAMLLAPLSFVVVFEIIRIGTDGPTVDAPVLSTYGVMALAVGRGFHGVVALAPMVLGAALGAGAARQRAARSAGDQRPTSRAQFAGRAGAALGALALVVLVALVVRPATTEPIIDASGHPRSDAVAELTSVDVDGEKLGVMIRGESRDNPVILFLAGGPGGSERGAMRNHLTDLERTFTVATWDQRGSGTSYSELDPADTLTLDGQVADTIAVTDHLRQRFGQERIYLLGQSWGSTLAVLAAQHAPNRYLAVIGTGQMVSQLETDQIFYRDTLAWADDHDRALAEELRTIGPPPYARMLDYETALAHEHEVYPYDHSGNSEGVGGFSENLLVPEYTLTDQVHLLGAFMDTFSVLYPQLQEIDFRRTATSFEVPVFFVQGAHEADGRAAPFAEWYPMIQAPAKDLVVLDRSGHRPLFEQPDEFVAYMNDVVLPDTQHR